jgi:hypothetical protein
MATKRLLMNSLFVLLLVLVLITSCKTVLTRSATGAGMAESSKISDHSSSAEAQRIMKLQLTLMSFADNFASSMMEEGSVILQNLSPRERRDLIASVLSSYASIIDIASGPDPGEALLDMLVLVSLKRIAWEEFWQPEVYGDSGIQKLATLKKLEEEIWKVSDDYLTPEQQNELWELIKEWRAENPERKKVEFVRFSSFGTLERKPALAGAGQLDGLLTSLTETLRTVDRIRMTAERALYRLSRAQLMTSVQLFMLTQNLETTSDRVIQNAISQISAERKEAVNQLMEGLAQERENALSNLRAEIERTQALLPQLKETLEAGTDLTVQVQDTIQSVEKFLESPAWDQRLPQILEVVSRLESSGTQLVDRTFIEVLVVILVFLVGLILVLLAYKFLLAKLFNGKCKEI